ncbi:MAG: hypothetical protein E7Z92_07045 [Cyanobacteria bacterium SIG31]|nr:hypothetical protein [Cyanobacteria bacterium SIG31]
MVRGINLVLGAAKKVFGGAAKTTNFKGVQRWIISNPVPGRVTTTPTSTIARYQESIFKCLSRGPEQTQVGNRVFSEIIPNKGSKLAQKGVQRIYTVKDVFNKAHAEKFGLSKHIRNKEVLAEVKIGNNIKELNAEQLKNFIALA